jgi:hypothetical protein
MLQTIKAELNAFYSFLHYPTYKPSNKHSVTDKWRRFAVLFLFEVLIILPIYMLFAEKFMTYVTGISSVPTTITGDFLGLLGMCVLVPITEECVFRLFLTSDKPSVSIWFILTAWILYNISLLDGSIIFLFCMNIMGLTGFFLLLQPNHSIIALCGAWLKKYFSVIFYLSTVIFAALHAYSLDLYGIYPLPVFLSIVYILTNISIQFIGGLILGYIRINNGMEFSILYHVFWNIIAAIAYYFFINPPDSGIYAL